MNRFSRRDLMKAGAMALAAPAVLRAHDALASSGTVSVFARADIFSTNSVLADFTNATGITVNLTTYRSDHEALTTLRAAGGKGSDVVFPTLNAGPAFFAQRLLQPVNEARFKTQSVEPALLARSAELGGTDRGTRYIVPFDWRTEGLTWDSTVFPKTSGDVSYGDLWLSGRNGQTAVRALTVFAGVARYLDSTGALPSNGGRDLFTSEADSRRVFDGCLAFLLAHKAAIGAFWTDAASATAAFATGGCTIGQTPDVIGMPLKRTADPKWRYGLPKEGGLGWMVGFAIPSGAANTAQTYELLDFLYRPTIAGVLANTTGHNSCARGAGDYLSDFFASDFAAAYPAGTLDALFWLPATPNFYRKLRNEYAAKLTG
ncbi:MAG TPA: extracellular solute-binding protein [Xanthobacteraceae bacterium]|nr:extracellular solute-binding protein [Xanthobacteraceae bacterium]